MRRIDDHAQHTAQQLHRHHPQALDAVPAFARRLRTGVLGAWTDLMGEANHHPNPQQRAASVALRDGLAPWFQDQGAPNAEPRTVLEWLITIDDRTGQLLCRQLDAVLDQLRSAPTT